MDKIKNISLGGFSFMIEEAAYNALSTYLTEVRKHLSKNEDANEILFDIEQRMAELLKERLIAREVIVTQDVQYLIDVLGKPEQYTYDETAEEPVAASHSNLSFSSLKKKKLYRNPDDKKIGGVLSGIGHYLTFDVTLLRILFASLLFVMLFISSIIVHNARYFFLPLLLVSFLYIIFWAIIPSADTTAEKLEMKGEAVNLDTISNFKNSNTPLQTTEWKRSFTDKKMFGVIGGFASYSGIDSTWLRIAYLFFTLIWIFWLPGVTAFSIAAYLLLALILKKEQPFESATPFTDDPLIPRQKGNIFFFLLKGFFIFLGILICIPLFVTLAALVVSLFAGSLVGGFSLLMLSDYLPYFAIHTWQQNLFYLSVTLLLLLPISLITLLSFKLFSKRFNTPRVWVVANILCVIIGGLGLLITAGSTARHFISHYQEEEKIPITTTADTLYVTEEAQYRYEQFLNVDDNRLVVTGSYFYPVKPTTEKEPFLVLIRESQGSSIRNAKQQMQHIALPLKIDNNHITIPCHYEIKKGNPFCGQRVNIHLYVPEGKYVQKSSNSTYSSKKELYRVTKDSLQLISDSIN